VQKGLEDALATSYRLDRELGRGGMATVYLAHDIRHNRRVAVKVLHPDLSHSIGPDRFLREIRALYMGAAALIQLGERDKALDWNRRAEAMEPDDPSVLYNVACGYSMLEMKKEGVASLTKAIDHGFGHWKWIEHDATLDPLRSEPGFIELLSRKPAEAASLES